MLIEFYPSVVLSHTYGILLLMFLIFARNIKLIPQWIPREQNELADYYSRIKDTDNWSIDNDRFRFINNLYRPFTVDRFAHNLNRKLTQNLIALGHLT